MNQVILVGAVQSSFDTTRTLLYSLENRNMLVSSKKANILIERTRNCRNAARKKLTSILEQVLKTRKTSMSPALVRGHREIG